MILLDMRLSGRNISCGIKQISRDNIKTKKNRVQIQIKVNAPFDINPITLMSRGVLLWHQREVQYLSCQLN